MIRIEAATAAMVDEVEPLFAGFRNEHITREQWRSIFEYPWRGERPERGFVLRDEQRCVGFIGTIWSTREIAGRQERICNLTSWITLPEYRNHSLFLLKAAVQERDCTITCHSPAAALYPIYKKLGFADLETQLRIVLPWPCWPPRLGVGARVFTRAEQIAPRLAENERRLLESHQVPGCGHLLVEARGEACYVVFTRTRGRRRHFSHLHYISDPAVLVRHIDRIKLHLFLVTRTPLLMIDARLVRGLEIPRSREVPLAVPHLLRSATLAPEQIDNLYSELILLGL